MKKLSKLKAVLLLLIFVVCLALPVKAQYSDGFFRNDMLYRDRDEGIGFNIGTQPFGSDVTGGIVITTQVFGQETPLDGGLLIMLGAGAVYAAKKRKKL